MVKRAGIATRIGRVPGEESLDPMQCVGISPSRTFMVETESERTRLVQLRFKPLWLYVDAVREFCGFSRVRVSKTTSSDSEWASSCTS